MLMSSANAESPTAPSISGTGAGGGGVYFKNPANASLADVAKRSVAAQIFDFISIVITHRRV
jgi:hypothetical protein